MDQSFMGISNTSTLFGLVIVSLHVGSLLANPIFGFITDLSMTTKTALLLGNSFEIAGNAMFCFSSNPSLLIISRLVTGIGTGANIGLLGMINCAIKKEEQTSKISRLVFFLKIGMVAAPLFYIVLSHPILYFWIGKYYINEYSIPTFFVLVFWIFHSILSIFLYYDLPAYNQEVNDFEESSSNCNSIKIQNHVSLKTDTKEETQLQQTNERVTTKLLFYFRCCYDGGFKCTCLVILSNVMKNMMNLVLQDLIAEEVVAFVFNGFAMCFTHAGINAVITPLSLSLFQWSDLENSKLYLGKGIMYLVSLILLVKLSKKFPDELLIVIGQKGVISCNLIFLLFVIFGINAGTDSPWLLGIFIFIFIFHAFAFPFAFTPLFSGIVKLTSKRNKGLNLAVFSVFVKLGTIMGIVWSTSLLDFQAPVMALVFLLVSILVWMMFIASYKQFEKRRTYIDLKEKSTSPTEDLPLIPTRSNE